MKRKPIEFKVTNIKVEVPKEEFEQRMKQAVTALIKMAKSDG